MTDHDPKLIERLVSALRAAEKQHTSFLALPEDDRGPIIVCAVLDALTDERLCESKEDVALAAWLAGARAARAERTKALREEFIAGAVYAHLYPEDDGAALMDEAARRYPDPEGSDQ